VGAKKRGQFDDPTIGDAQAPLLAIGFLAMGATRLNLHAIAVLGVKPEPLRGRLAMSGLEYISRMRGAAHPSARRWLFCF